MITVAEKSDRLFSLGIVATLAFAIACFTPTLSGLLYVAHLSWIMNYADFVLFPALAVSVVVMIVGYLEWRQGGAILAAA